MNRLRLACGLAEYDECVMDLNPQSTSVASARGLGCRHERPVHLHHRLADTSSSGFWRLKPCVSSTISWATIARNRDREASGIRYFRWTPRSGPRAQAQVTARAPRTGRLRASRPSGRARPAPTLYRHYRRADHHSVAEPRPGSSADSRANEGARGHPGPALRAVGWWDCPAPGLNVDGGTAQRSTHSGDHQCRHRLQSPSGLPSSVPTHVHSRSSTEPFSQPPWTSDSPLIRVQENRGRLSDRPQKPVLP